MQANSLYCFAALFYLKFSSKFNELSLSSKSNRKWQKKAKTKIVQKNAYMWHSGTKG